MDAPNFTFNTAKLTVTSTSALQRWVQNQTLSTGWIPSMSPIPTHINCFDANLYPGTGFGWALAWGKGIKDRLCVSSHRITEHFFSCLLNILWMRPEHCKIKLSWVILMKSSSLGEKIQEVFEESTSISHCVAAAEIKFWLILFKSSSKWLFWPLIVSGFLIYARGQTSKRPRRYGQGVWRGERRGGVLM